MEFYSVVTNKPDNPHYVIIDSGIAYFYEKDLKKLKLALKTNSVRRRLEKYQLMNNDDEIAKLLLIHKGKSNGR